MKETVEQWRVRALARARTLKGRPHTPAELEFLKTCEDHWDYFSAFGIQPETQSYIDVTIRLLETKCVTLADQCVCSIRLKWTITALRGEE